jgi:REP element-mobilizing transposase RayT
MARPLRIEYPGAFYHITSRGNERKEIYMDTGDREKFLFYLETAAERYGSAVHVYCLMGNHYHLLLETPRGNLSQIMRHVNGAYTSYFNAKRERSGHLFQGRYKAILVDADVYASELSRYIHLNPVRAGMVQRPEEYPWSSYGSYVGMMKKPSWCTVDFILRYFGEDRPAAQKRYHEFVHDLIGKEYRSPLEDTFASTILGGEEFIHRIKSEQLRGKMVDRDVPALREISRGPSIKEIVKEVEAVFDEGSSLTKQASYYLCHRYSGKTLREIGSYFRVGESAVSLGSRRFRKKLMEDRYLREMIEGIEKRINV